MRVELRSKSSVTLPMPPSTNNLFATARGRRVKTREYRAWLAACAPALLELRKPDSLPAWICVVALGAVNARRDLDNLLKPVGDALVANGVLPGDSLAHVRRWSVEYAGDGAGEAAVRVAVFPMPPAAAQA